MRNLSGVEDCDRYIERELHRARIPSEQIDRTHREVPYSVVGKLGEISLTRGWIYWIAEGNVPIETAEELYDDPVGTTDIRVAGSAGAPHPAELAVWLTADGKIVYPLEQEKRLKEMELRHPGITNDNDIFSDDPESLGAKQYVTSYHIDTELGLRIFADTLLAHDLAEAPVAR